jgi:hypothetical protein
MYPLVGTAPVEACKHAWYQQARVVVRIADEGLRRVPGSQRVLPNAEARGVEVTVNGVGRVEQDDVGTFGVRRQLMLATSFS